MSMASNTRAEVATVKVAALIDEFIGK